MTKIELEYLANLSAVVNRILRLNIIGHENAGKGTRGVYHGMEPYFNESAAMVEKSKAAESYFRKRVETFDSPVMD